MSNLQNNVRWCMRAQVGLTALLFALFGGFWLAGYRPLTARLHNMQARISQGQCDLRDNLLRTRALPALAAEVKTLRERLDQSQKLPPQQELPQFLKELTGAGQDCALKKFVIKPGLAAREPLFREMPINLCFEGDYIDVFNFLRRTEQMHRLIRVRSLSMKAPDGATGQVQVQAVMNIYFSPDDLVPEAKATHIADAR